MAGPAAPRGLGRRGRKLWRDITSAHDLAPAELIVLAEACRTADRLEQLDELLRGDVETWSRVQLPSREDDDELILRIDPALSEARQQATVLKQLLAALRLPDAESGAKPQRRPGARGAYKPTGGRASGSPKVSSILDRLG